LEQAPVSFREPRQQFADFKVIASHGADPGNELFADVFGHGFPIHFESEVVTALGGIFVKRALEEFQSIVDLALELFLAELEEFGLFAHEHALLYAYHKAGKSACQAASLEPNAKNASVRAKLLLFDRESH
jgi:hypothetical protein